MLGPEDVENLQPLFDYFESMVQHHSIFLRDLEHRIVMWESRAEETHRIGDVMLKNMVVLPIYEEYVEVHREILQRLNDLFTSDDRFQQIYKDFEQEKVSSGCKTSFEIDELRMSLSGLLPSSVFLPPETPPPTAALPDADGAASRTLHRRQ
jgi:hypothetical protein